MGCCNSGSQELILDKRTSRQIGSRMFKPMTEEEAWSRVNVLWTKNKLKPEESMTLEMATPFIQDYMKEVKGVQRIDDGLVMQIFNEIDGDGNQALDQKEMYDFIKN